MSLVEDFIRTPSVSLLDKCTKEQLLRIAEHYKIEVQDKRVKVKVKIFLMDSLVTQAVLPEEADTSEDEAEEGKKVLFSSAPLSFEQQKELLEMKLQHEKEMEQIKQKTELLKLELEQEKLKMSVREKKQFDVGSNLKLLPKFSESDPDLFFSLFERVADARDWSDSERTLLLQCVITGKAQEAYASLTVMESKNYEMVKSTVLRAYELVPEAYRQRFRNLKKKENQTYVDFMREMLVQFNRWCVASEVQTFKELCNLITIEQLKNCVPVSIATYITEKKVKTPQEAAILADEYCLTHKSVVGREDTQQTSGPGHTGKRFGWQGDSTLVKGEQGSGKQDDPNVCHYCHQSGHWKKDCVALKAREMLTGAQIKPAALAASVIPSPQLMVKTTGCDFKGEYAAFLSEGYVALPGKRAVRVNILRDTGALHTFIRQDVLPFSSASETGDFIFMQGMGMRIIPVPLHSMNIVCGLVGGEVVVGVRPQLPVEGVDIILG